MTKTLAEIKAESGRDLDEGLAETTLVPGEGANFGAFKLGALWTWIKSKFANVVEANNMNAVTSNAVNTAVTAITAKIPDSATSSNKLATESEITGINAKIPSDATSENKLVSTTQLNGSLTEYEKTVDLDETLKGYVKKSSLESFTLRTATGAFRIDAQYCFMYNNHVHLECYGTVNQSISSASNQPLIVIPTNYKPNITYTTIVGCACLNDEIYPATASVRTLSSGDVCLYQGVTNSLSDGARIKFICDYII